MESEIKSLTNLFKFCHNLPKLELHAHLTGCVRPSTILELLADESDKDKFSELVQGRRTVEDCFKIFYYIYKILNSLEVVKRITREMLEDWSKQNCFYLEIRTNIKDINDKNKYDYLVAVLNEIDSFNNDKVNNLSGMQTRLILSINRNLPQKEAFDTLEVFKRLRIEQPGICKLVVGVDFSGLEGNDSFNQDELLLLLDEYRKFGMKVTIHIAEVKDFIKLNYEKLKPDRLGHTDYFSAEDAQEVIDLGIPYECCPSSSLTRLAYISYKEVNLKNFYKKKNSKTGVEYTKFSINTDDTSLFFSNLTQEYYEIAAAFGMDEKEISNVVLNSIDTIFDDDYKVELKKRVSNFIEKLN